MKIGRIIFRQGDKITKEDIHHNGRFSNWQKPEIEHGKTTQWGWRVYYPENLILGRNVDIGFGCFLQAKNGIEIADDVQIGGGCFLYSVSTIDGKEGKIVIRKDARIGTLSIIMPGITIGKSAIIGAHSLVNGDVPDNEVWFGIPARSRRKNL